MTGMGIVLLYRSCCILEQSREALNWPQTKGHIISSLLTVHHYPKFIGLSVDPARWYGAGVRYEYTVGDGLYLSDRLAFQKSDTMSPKEALKVMNKYRRLHEAPVYYDPKDPKESVLQPGYTGEIYIPFIMGAFLAFGGIFILYSQSLEFNHGKSNYIHRGHIYQNQEKFEEALLEYTQAIRINPSSSLGYSHRGNLYLQQKSWDKAIADFNQALAIDPEDALIYFSLANAYLGKKQYDKAWANMNKAKENGFNVAPEILEELRGHNT